MRAWFNSVIPLTQDELLAKWCAENPTWTEEEVAWQVESKVQVSPNVVQTFDQPEPRWRETLPAITCLILLLTGDRDNGLISPADVQAMFGLWHDGRVIQVEGASHMVHCDRFGQFVEAVRAYLAGV